MRRISVSPLTSPQRALVALAMVLLPGALRAQIAVLSSTVEERVAAPGERYTGTITIVNTTNQPQTARVYQTDYRFAFDGTSNFDEPGSSTRSNATWITPQLTHVVVPPSSRVSVPYSVVIPASDSLRGTYWSTVMVEGIPVDPANTNANSGKPSMDVGAVIRYAVQVATHIQTTGSHTVRFMDPNAVKNADGTTTLDLNVQDVGERGYRPSLWVEVYDAQGNVRAKAKQLRGLLYPGTSLHQHFDLGVLPPGTYKAVVFADTGDDAVFATQYTITF